jgi:hypothetical protein
VVKEEARRTKMIMKSPEEIAQALIDAFQTDNAKPTPEEVEAVLRPFDTFSTLTERVVRNILYKRNFGSLGARVCSWFEANVVVSGDESDREKAIQWLQRDTCTCVLEHLPNAVENATGLIDPRVTNLFDHPFFQKQSEQTEEK